MSFQFNKANALHVKAVISAMVSFYSTQTREKWSDVIVEYEGLVRHRKLQEDGEDCVVGGCLLSRLYPTMESKQLLVDKIVLNWFY